MPLDPRRTKATKTGSKATKSAKGKGKGKNVQQAGKGWTPSRSKIVGDAGRATKMQAMLYPTDEDPNAREEALSGVLSHPPEVHETIERAYQVFLSHRRAAQSRSLSLRYDSLTSALEALRVTDPRLFASTTLAYKFGNVTQEKGKDVGATGKLRGLVPRQMRIPTEEGVPEGKDAWNEGWVNNTDPLEELAKRRPDLDPPAPSS